MAPSIAGLYRVLDSLGNIQGVADD
jgi:hypothetical protein